MVHTARDLGQEMSDPQHGYPECDWLDLRGRE